MSASASAGVAGVARAGVGVAGGGGRPVGRVACVAVINHNVRLQSRFASSSWLTHLLEGVPAGYRLCGGRHRPVIEEGGQPLRGGAAGRRPC